MAASSQAPHLPSLLASSASQSGSSSGSLLAHHGADPDGRFVAPGAATPPTSSGSASMGAAGVAAALLLGGAGVAVGSGSVGLGTPQQSLTIRSTSSSRKSSGVNSQGSVATPNSAASSAAAIAGLAGAMLLLPEGVELLSAPTVPLAVGPSGSSTSGSGASSGVAANLGLPLFAPAVAAGQLPFYATHGATAAATFAAAAAATTAGTNGGGAVGLSSFFGGSGGSVYDSHSVYASMDIDDPPLGFQTIRRSDSGSSTLNSSAVRSSSLQSCFIGSAQPPASSRTQSPTDFSRDAVRFAPSPILRTLLASDGAVPLAAGGPGGGPALFDVPDLQLMDAALHDALLGESPSASLSPSPSRDGLDGPLSTPMSAAPRVAAATAAGPRQTPPSSFSASGAGGRTGPSSNATLRHAVPRDALFFTWVALEAAQV